MANKTYEEEIWKYLEKWIRKRRIYFVWFVLLNILALFVLYGYSFLIFGKGYAIENTVQQIIVLLSFDLIVGFGYFAFVGFWEIPAEIYYEQKKIIDERLPEQLSLSIEHAPTNLLNTIGGKSARAAFLLIKSGESKKIVELRAIINFEHFIHQPSRRFVRQTGYDLNALLFWDDDKEQKKEIQLRPNDLKFLVLCELIKGKTDDGNSVEVALMCSDPVVSNTTFSNESICQIEILFQGKLEGEYKFRTFHYSDALYFKPKDQRILFLDEAVNAYDDIPKSLLEKAKRFKKWKRQKRSHHLTPR